MFCRVGIDLTNQFLNLNINQLRCSEIITKTVLIYPANSCESFKILECLKKIIFEENRKVHTEASKSLKPTASVANVQRLKC